MSFTYKKHQIYLLLDHTFFNDAFRSDYPHEKDALWIWSYNIARYTFKPDEKIIIVPKITLDILKKKGRYEVTRNIYAINKLTNIIETGDNSSELAIIKIAILLNDHEKIPNIITSRKEAKWLDDIKRLSLSYEIKSFSKQMSIKRLKNYFPGYIKTPVEAREIISKYDSIYKKTNKITPLE